MLKSQQGLAFSPVKYSDIWVRIALSFIGGYFIAAVDIWEPFYKLVQKPKFLLLVFVIAVAAFGIISYIRWISKKLDKKITWERDTLQRILMQFLLGLLVAFGMAFYVGSFMYKEDVSMWETGWLSRYGLVEGMMLFAVNVYYIFWYISVKHRLFSNKEVVVEPVDSVDHILFVTNPGDAKILHRKSSAEPKIGSMKSIFETLSPKDYQIFGQSCIIRLDNILYVEDEPGGGANVFMKIPEGHKIFVSERQKGKLKGFYRK